MATRQSSRALTIVAALERLDLLANPPSDGHLIIHILGADTREGSSFSQTAAVFLPLCERLRDSSIYTVDLLLCGPNCASATASQSRPADAGPLLSVQYSSLTYEVWRKQNADASWPHLAVAFQSGLWGYDSWRPCIESICAANRCPLLLTEYNSHEAEDVEDVLRDWGVVHWKWTAEANPWRSDVPEERVRTQEHILYENASWMCIVGPLKASSGGGGATNETQLMMDADEAIARGFSADEEIVMPMPNFDDSSEDDDAEAEDESLDAVERQNGCSRPPVPPPPPPPSAEHVQKVLYGDPAHAHANRSMRSNAAAAFGGLQTEDGLPAARRLKRVPYKKLSKARLAALKRTPLIVTGVPEHEGWPAASGWRSETALVESSLGERLMLPITELFPLHGFGKPQKVKLPLRTYREYASTNTVDFPYYPWEREFDEPVSSNLLNQWWPPSLLSTDDDLFATSDATRRIFPFSCHRFVIIGGERTGAVAHQDPKCSEAWNTCLLGRKRWCFLPPSVTPEQLKAAIAGAENGSDSGANGKSADGEDYRRVPPAYWWHDAYPKLAASNLPLLECVQEAGETVYVPPLWWHAIFNLPDNSTSPPNSLTLCVTQNLLTPSTLLELTWPKMREHLGDENARLFATEVYATRPHLIRRLLTTCEEGSAAAEELRALIDGGAATNGCDDDEEEAAATEPAVDVADSSVAEGLFTAEVKRRAAAAEEARNMLSLEIATNCFESALPTPHDTIPYGRVDRVEATSMSVAEFRERYIRGGEAAVLCGLGGVIARPYEEEGVEGVDADTPPPHLCGGLDRLGWLTWLGQTCGSKRVEVLSQRSTTSSRSTGECASSVTLLSELIEKIKSGRAEGLYMYDVSLAKRLPSVMSAFRLPVHFAHDYLKRTRREHRFSSSWPTLFLGARGTRSTLHLDQWHGHFWMVCLVGCKRWTLFDPEDTPYLYPDWSKGGLHPTFPSLHELQARPDLYPLFPRARRSEVVVHAGEVLFVPGGTPHAVENLTDSLAYAGNFVDDSNLSNVLEEMRWLAMRDKQVGEAMAALEEMDMAAEEEADEREGLLAEELVVGLA